MKKINFNFSFSDLIGIIGITISISIGLIQMTQLDSEIIVKLLIIAILLPSLVIMFINMLIEDYTILKGNKEMYKRLEELFIDLYINAKK